MQLFLRTLSVTVALATAGATAGCNRDGNHGDMDVRHGATLSQSDAAKITDATVATWQSMDASKIDALYASDIVGFDVSAAPLSTDRANWTKLQQGFAGMKFDHLAITQSKTQILDPNGFVFSSLGTLTSSAGALKSLPIRCTDVYHRQDDNKFLIVNEHCSSVPAAKA
jgi:ketosteroid isomerase-like protein